MSSLKLALVAGLVLAVSGGCAATRGANGRVVNEAEHNGTSGEYKPWNDVNNRPLPRTWFPWFSSYSSSQVGYPFCNDNTWPLR